MRRRYPPSIVSGFWRDKWTEEYRGQGVVRVEERVYGSSLKVRIRRCMVCGKPSGGTHFQVTLGQYQHSPSSLGYRLSFYATMDLAARKIMHWAYGMVTLAEARERLYEELGCGTLPKEIIEKVAQLEENTGHTSAYTDMSLEDIDFWREELVA